MGFGVLAGNNEQPEHNSFLVAWPCKQWVYCCVRRINFNLTELEAFVAVADNLSFQSAAGVMHISASALSRRISQLETMLGARLFDRNTRNVSLTNVGRVFLSHARAVLNELENGILRITDLATNRGGQVTIACIPSATYSFLPNVLHIFHAQYPKIRVRVIDERANPALNTVIHGEADFGINFVGTQEPGIDFLPILSESFVLAMLRSHPLAGRQSVKWEELLDESFMSTSRDTGNRLMLDHALAKVKNRPAAFFEAGHVTTLISMVAAGLGVAAVPRMALSAHNNPNLVGVPLVKPVVGRRIGLVSSRSRLLTPQAKILFDMLCAAAEGHSDRLKTKRSSSRLLAAK